MISVLLLAKNFVRQNRWLLLAFVLWPLLLASLVRPSSSDGSSDAAEIMQQETVYGLVVVGFLASSAIYNEKRSRRIVAVLSKAVSRTQYLLGFVVGAICFAAAYFASVAITAIWLMHDLQFAPVAAAAWYAQVLVASVWICSAALLFATFLHPLLAAALTGVCAFAPLAFSYRTVFLSPVTILIERLAATPAQIAWTAMSIAAVESVIFVAAAGIIFARRDVTLSIE